MVAVFSIIFFGIILLLTISFGVGGIHAAERLFEGEIELPKVKRLNYLSNQHASSHLHDNYME